MPGVGVIMPAFVEIDERVDVVRGVVIDPRLDIDAPSLGLPLSLRVNLS